MLSDYVAGAIRTLVPKIISFILSFALMGRILADFGIDSRTATEQGSVLAALALSYAYYLIAHALELKYPKLKVLLGGVTPPAYNTTTNAPDVDDWQQPLDQGHQMVDPEAGAVDAAFLVLVAQFVFYIVVALAAAVYIVNHLHHH